MSDGSMSIVSSVHIKDLSGFLEFLRSKAKANDGGVVDKVFSGS